MDKTDLDADYAITYEPTEGKNAGKRFTAWLKWVTYGDPPKDFGNIVRIQRLDRKTLSKIEFKPPTKKDIAWARRMSARMK